MHETHLTEAIYKVDVCIGIMSHYNKIPSKSYQLLLTLLRHDCEDFDHAQGLDSKL